MYIAYANSKQFKVCDSLADALEAAELFGGDVYERLASDAVRQIAVIEDALDLLSRCYAVHKEGRQGTEKTTEEVMDAVNAFMTTHIGPNWITSWPEEKEERLHELQRSEQISKS